MTCRSSPLHNATSSALLCQRLGIRYPILLSPMAGVCTPRLAAEVSIAGGLGGLGIGGSPTPTAARAQLTELKQLLLHDEVKRKEEERIQRAEGGKQMRLGSEGSSPSFQANVFCHNCLPPPTLTAQREWIEAHMPLFQRFGADPPAALREPYPSFLADGGGADGGSRRRSPHHSGNEEKNQRDTQPSSSSSEKEESMLHVLTDPVCSPSAVSFHFGLPHQWQLDTLKARGIATLATATCLQSALAAYDMGIDVIVAQGIEAGGHRGVMGRVFEEKSSPSLLGIPCSGEKEEEVMAIRELLWDDPCMTTVDLVRTLRRSEPLFHHVWHENEKKMQLAPKSAAPTASATTITGGTPPPPLLIVAAGGIMTPQHVSTMLSADVGASGVQMGTVFIPCRSSAANKAYRRALLPSSTSSSSRSLSSMLSMSSSAEKGKGWYQTAAPNTTTPSRPSSSSGGGRAVTPTTYMTSRISGRPARSVGGTAWARYDAELTAAAAITVVAGDAAIDIGTSNNRATTATMSSGAGGARGPPPPPPYPYAYDLAKKVHEAAISSVSRSRRDDDAPNNATSSCVVEYGFGAMWAGSNAAMLGDVQRQIQILRRAGSNRNKNSSTDDDITEANSGSANGDVQSTTMRGRSSDFPLMDHDGDEEPYPSAEDIVRFLAMGLPPPSTGVM